MRRARSRRTSDSARRPRRSPPPRRACRRNSGSRALSSGLALASAASMVWPQTNCSPSTRIAVSTLARMIGAPERAISRVSVAPSPVSSTVPTSRPVIRSPQVAALTNGEGDWPTWARHSPPPTLSAIRASRVAASGMRSSASAMHISATPSWLESAYSRISPCTSPPAGRARRPSISLRASAAASALTLSGSSAASARRATQDSNSGGAIGGVDFASASVMPLNFFQKSIERQRSGLAEEDGWGDMARYPPYHGGAISFPIHASCARGKASAEAPHVRQKISAIHSKLFSEFLLQCNICASEHILRCRQNFCMSSESGFARSAREATIRGRDDHDLENQVGTPARPQGTPDDRGGA